MNIKSEIEIKEEKYDYDSYQQSSQIFLDSDINLASVESTKDEEFAKVSVKSEFKETEKESMLVGELVNVDVIKSEDLAMIERKPCDQHLNMSDVPSTSTAFTFAASTGQQPCTSTSDELRKVQKALFRRKLDKDDAVCIAMFPGEESEDDDDDDDYGWPAARSMSDEEATRIITALQASNALEVDDGKETENDELHSHPVPTPPAEKRRAYPSKPIWKKASFFPPVDVSWKDQEQYIVDDSWSNFLPIDFFYFFFDLSLFSYIAQQSNVYALQSAGKDLKLQADDFKVYIGILMKLAILKPPSFRYVWQKSSGLDSIAKFMSRDRFFDIKRFLHFNAKPKDNPQFDRFQKIRYVIERVRGNCRKLPLEEYHSVDEQMIPTKAHHALKQYQPNKPHKWGYKVITRAGASGIVYDFIFYEGKGTISDERGVGVSSSYLLKLIEDIPPNKNYKVFFDNWFSSLALAGILQEKGILFVSTVRLNQLKGVTFKEEKILKREGRGSYDDWVDKVTDCVAIRWYDNKSVHLLSNYAGVKPHDMCRRWDAKKQTYVEIERPFAVHQYNKYIGGVNLADKLINLYRINFKSKKWYTRIFYYLLDLCVVNAWLLYRRVHESNVHRKNLMPLVDFKTDVADGLLNSTISVTPRERQSSTRGGAGVSARKINSKSNQEYAPAQSVRYDNVSHWPLFTENRKRCKLCINFKTSTMCEKCKVHLCLLNREENTTCFVQYHKQ